MKNRAIWLAVMALAGCGTEVGRVPLSGEGSGTGKAKLQAGEVVFWTDLDVDYEGDLGAAYDVKLTLGGHTLSASCDPFDVNVKTKAVTTSFNGKHSKRYNGKMKCSVTAPSAGEATIETTFKAGGPAQFRKADLVIKQ